MHTGLRQSPRGQTRSTNNNKSAAIRPGNCPGPAVLSVGRSGWGWGGFLGGEGGPQKTGRNDWPPCVFYSAGVGSGDGCSAASSKQVHSFAWFMAVGSSSWRPPPCAQLVPRQQVRANASPDRYPATQKDRNRPILNASLHRSMLTASLYLQVRREKRAARP